MGLAAFPYLVAVRPDGRTLTTAAARTSTAEPMETKVQTSADILARMQQEVPPGRQCLNGAELRQLATHTQALLASKPAAQEEYSRFLAAARKDIDLPHRVLAACLKGKRILVSGGTGCIGATLMAQLARLEPAYLVSVSRGVTQGWPRVADADYVHADIRDRDQLAAVFDHANCDIVFHVAGQRDPGLAEHEVHRTVTTNVLGTRNVVSAAAASGVSHVVAASTGKAFRPYSPEIYTASKRAAEWLLCRAAADGLTACSAARFTHVIDNSIIHARLLDWCNGGLIRLHSPDIAFYVQSARQSARLLLAAAAGAQRGSLRVHAINDLGWPVALVDVALGVLARTGSTAPIYFSGYDRGYESAPFPALYDPMTAGDMSPLISGTRAADGSTGRHLRADGAARAGPCRARRAFLGAVRRHHGGGSPPGTGPRGPALRTAARRSGCRSCTNAGNDRAICGRGKSRAGGPETAGRRRTGHGDDRHTMTNSVKPDFPGLSRI